MVQALCVVLYYWKAKTGGESMTKSKKPGETWNGHVSSAVKTAYNRRNYQAITFRVRLDGADGLSKEQIDAAAQAAGMSVNAWIIEAIRDRL
jgi:predicted HicB family RNase H-like nuclease